MKNIILITIICLFGLDSFGQRSTANGVVGYWRMETTSFLDETNNSNDGTNNGATITTGKVNSCGDFESTESDYVTVADNSGLDLSAFSISAWVNLESTIALDKWSAVLAKGGSGETSTVNHNYALIIENDIFGTGHAIAALYENSSGGNTIARYSFTPSTSTWYHLAAVYDGSSNLIMYVNGVAQATNSSATDTPNTNNIVISFARPEGNSFSSNNAYIDGKIDEILLYQRGLSELEVKNHYAGGNGLLYITQNYINEKISFSDYWAYLSQYCKRTNKRA